MPLSKIVANSITDNTITTDQIADTSVHGRRNLIINGAMQVAQRSTSETGRSSGGFATMDRFIVSNTGRDEHVYTEAQVSDAPDGFVYSFKMTTTTPETSIDANDGFWVEQKIEAQNVQHLQNGSSGALSTTLSFYVKSSQTGTFGVSLYKSDNTARIINSTYTISSADTWEYKTITFAGDTAGGGIDNNNGEGLRDVWHLAAGSNYDSINSTSWADYGTQNWAGGHAQDGVITTTNATWQITGAQLEIGSQASPFEHRSFGEELESCKRYFQKVNDLWFNANRFGDAHWDGHIPAGHHEFHPEMRAAPSASNVDIDGWLDGDGDWTSTGSLAAGPTGMTSKKVNFTGNYNWTGSYNSTHGWRIYTAEYDAEL